MVWQKMSCGGHFDTELYCLGENGDVCKECPCKYSNWLRKKLFETNKTVEDE